MSPVSSVSSAAGRYLFRRAAEKLLTWGARFPQRRNAQVLDSRFFQTHSERLAIAEKYQRKLEEKARREGLSGVEQLKVAYQDKIQQVKVEASALGPGVTPALLNTEKTQLEEYSKSRPTAPSIIPLSKGVKNLSSFVDIDKLLLHSNAKDIELLWRARFLKDARSLCATLRSDSYNRMAGTARKHPMFILPLPREGQGVEMHFMQWAFPAENASTVMFTTLAEYKLRGEFASPHTTITHHLELSKAKGLVLLQGQVMPDRGVDLDQAKFLLLQVQKFYGDIGGEERSKTRRDLLEKFSTGREDFEIQSVIKEVEIVP